MHNRKIDDVFHELKASPKGLTNEEATRRLHKYGLNELKEEEKISPLTILLEQFKSPLIWLLLVALVISVFLGEVIDASVIGAIVILNAILGFIQEYRAEKAIEALKKMASLKARVLRDGKEITIDAARLVPGDVVLLEAGDKIPADSRLFEIHELRTQEAALTGESMPIRKELVVLDEKTAVADRRNMVYSGTIIANGRGRAVVAATGMKTEFGKIASLIEQAKEKLTPLQKKLRTLGKYLTIAVIIVAIVVFLAGFFTGKEIPEIFLVAVALAVAAIPEGLPAVVTISLALGVQRMIKRNALIRKLPSVETLGAVNVICADKTGTLTHNQMTVTHILANNKIYTVTGSGYSKHGTFVLGNRLVNADSFKQLLTCGALCNNAKLEEEKKKTEVVGDPTEASLIVSAAKAGYTLEGLEKQFPRVDEIPFSSERKMMTTLHDQKGKRISFTKGAPDVIIELCDRIAIDGKIERLTLQKKKEILKQNEEFAKKALRVLGFAYNARTEQPEKNMIFLGLQAMIDPPRVEVKEAIRRCKKAGIRTIMITGDHIITAQAIAQELGISGKAITGQELRKTDLNKAIDNLSIFARVNPEDKLKIIEALKNRKYVVAMTGDGVNDAPALKKSDIGIAMGITGTDVAKEASDMILTDDNFTSIVNAVEEGRGIFDNIRKFVNYLLSSNLGEILVIFLASIFGMPLPITAVQLLWINLVTDGLPATALSFDPSEKGIMKRKPRPFKESILSKDLRWNIIILGTMIGIATLILFWLYRGSILAKAQTIAFTTLVVFEMVRLQMIRSEYRLGIFSNKWLVGAVAISLLLQLAVIYTPLSRFFNTVALELMDWVWIILAAAILIAINYLIAFIKRRIKNK